MNFSALRKIEPSSSSVSARPFNEVFRLRSGYGRRVYNGMYSLCAQIYIAETPDITLLVQCAPKWAASFVRLEYNPASADPELVRPYVDFIVPGGNETLVNKGKCTRIDVTVDVHFADINQMLVSHPGFKKTSAYYGNGGIETLYIGTLESRKRFCIYDKVAEIKHKNKNKLFKTDIPTHSITRIESRIRQDIYLKELITLTNPFEKLCIAYPPSPLSNDPILPLFLECWRSKGAHDALLTIGDKELRRKYRKLLTMNTPSWWKPDAIWKQWPSVIDKILYPAKTAFTLELLKKAS